MVSTGRERSMGAVAVSQLCCSLILALGRTSAGGAETAAAKCRRSKVRGERGSETGGEGGGGGGGERISRGKQMRTEFGGERGGRKELTCGK